MSLNGAIANAVWGGGVDLSGGAIKTWWNLDEEIGTRSDQTAAHNLTMVGTVPRIRSPFGWAASFVGNNSNYLETADHADFETGSGATSIYWAGWVYKGGTGNYEIWGKAVVGGQVILKSLSVEFHWWNGGGYGIASKTITIPANRWYFVEAWYTGGTGYVDINRSGSPGSFTAVWDDSFNTNEFRIGYSLSGFAPFVGAVARLTCFKGYVPTEKERNVLYNGGHGASYQAVTARTILVGTPGTPSTDAERYAEAIWSYIDRQTSDPTSYGQYLKAYYKTDETGASPVREDSYGTSDASPTGTVNDVTGKIGNAADFSNSCLRDYTLNLGDSTKDYTVVAWVYLDTVGAHQVIFNYRWNSTPEDGSWWCGFDPTGVPAFFRGSGGGFGGGTMGAAVSIGAWKRVVYGIGVDGDIDVWVDGVFHGTTVGLSRVNSAALGIALGAVFADGTSNPFDGKLDEIAVLEGFLADSTFAVWDYNSGNGRTFEEWGAAATGGEGATATLDAIIDNLTLVFTGYVDVEAGYNGVISDVTVSSNTQVSVQGQVSQTLNNVTLQSTVVASATANLNQTIDNLTLVSSVVFDFEAALDATIDSINLNSSLIVHPQASLNVTLDNLTLVSTITDGSTPSRVYPIFGSSIFV